jgi:hypothetical protein
MKHQTLPGVHVREYAETDWRDKDGKRLRNVRGRQLWITEPHLCFVSTSTETRLINVDSFPVQRAADMIAMIEDMVAWLERR